MWVLLTGELLPNVVCKHDRCGFSKELRKARGAEAVRVRRPFAARVFRAALDAPRVSRRTQIPLTHKHCIFGSDNAPDGLDALIPPFHCPAVHTVLPKLV